MEGCFPNQKKSRDEDFHIPPLKLSFLLMFPSFIFSELRRVCPPSFPANPQKNCQEYEKGMVPTYKFFCNVSINQTRGI